MAKKDIHVVPHKDGWAAEREGSSRPFTVEPTQAKAIDAGRDAAKRDEVELVIHNRQGEIRNSNSFGNDPAPPVDKKH